MPGLLLLLVLMLAAAWLLQRPPRGSTSLLATALPPAGYLLTDVFCWGHPLAVLGPGMLFLGTPLALGLAVRAVQHAADRALAVAALVVAGAEAAGLMLLLTMR